jgi:hypothetical protein
VRADSPEVLQDQVVEDPNGNLAPGNRLSGEGSRRRFQPIIEESCGGLGVKVS